MSVYVKCQSRTQAVCTHSWCVETAMTQKNDHIANFGIRSWLEKRLNEEGLFVKRTFNLDVLEKMLDLIGAER